MSEVEKLFEEFKGRLVEVECECDNEKRAKCVMYPEYCDGTRKEIIDLVQLIDEGLNNKLLSDKDTRIEELEQENAELKAYRQDCVKLTEDNVVIARQRAETAKQLTKAKEHIRTLISCLINWVQEGDKDYCYITDAEQFLKESENEGK